MINSPSTTVNQLLLATTLFYDLSELNWFAVTNFRDQRFIHTCISITLSAAINIRDNEVPANLAKIYRMRIKIGLQY